ncbi:MAG: PAS domain S-box protein, partial [Hymenobacteraceae bacterium]|nr:PAS domain S-box protein [Hymenobacteraceae bacterium]MDX5396314.1 PAS domain S-box protein [Hymenobacteraceae bacterium]MDX5512373.1 PAS domain S-box protein [Hymenobacteraceae bacterium]
PAQTDGTDTMQKAEALYQETIESEKPKQVDWLVTRKDGSQFEAEVFLTRVFFNNKYLVHGSFRDITQRKQAQNAIRREEVLRESMQHFRNFLEKVNLAYISLDMKGNLVYVNDYFLKYTEYEREELIGKNYFDIFLPEEEKEKRKESFERMMEQGVLNSYYERDIVTKSGMVKTLRWNSVFEIDSEGKIIGLTSVGKDMTDKRVAMEALKDNKIRLQDLFDNAHDLIQNISVDNKFIFVNKAWKEKLGYNDHDIEKLTLNDIVHPYYKAKLIYQLRNLYKGENLNKIETVFLTKSGKPVHLIGSINCSWQDGRPVATRAILHDITDRIKAERLQKVYYSIANLAISSKDLKSLYAAIHRELSKIIETRNIYIALSNEAQTELSFVYFIDQNSNKVQTNQLNRAFSSGISEYIIKTGKPLFALKKDFLQLIEEGKIKQHGTLPEVMLCSPLAIGDRIIGVIAVQDYHNPDAYVQTDIEILHFISNQVALAIERKQNEEKINNQNARLKAIFDSGSHLMWSMNRNYQLTSFNQAFSNSFQKKSGIMPVPGTKLTTNRLNFIKNGYRRVWMKNYKMAFEGAPQHFELQLKEPDGSSSWLEVYLNPIYLEDGYFEEVSAIALDITEEKKSQLALSLSEEKFRRIFESFQDLFCRFDTQGKIVLISPSVTDILGYSPEEVIGKNSRLYFADPQDIDTLRDRVLLEESVHNFETKLTCKDGTIKDMLMNARAIYDENKQPIGIEGVSRDIGELKKTQLELIRAKEMAESLLQAKTQFLANMSHELRTPMNGIIGMIDLLNHTISSEEQREYVDTLRKSSDALLAILNDILDLSKIQAGKMVVNETAIDLKYTLNKIHSLFANRAHQKKLNFTYHIHPGTPRYILTDETRFLQILSNLTSNAIKFTNQGEVVINVRSLSSEGKVHKLEVQVKDSGIGITEEDKQLLFTNFTQLDNSSTKSFGGTGLGLAISKQL